LPRESCCLLRNYAGPEDERKAKGRLAQLNAAWP
jgi:hypothetical protein